MDIFQKLSAEFPRESIHWRAQTVTKSGDKALALAYIDARDVMARLDDVLTPAGWQDSYTETARGRVVGTISIDVGDGLWISKSDGAGDTAVEGEKGGISDAFKRTAVKWGVGRYLYAMPAVWCPCETYEKGGKRHWAKWTTDPWSLVKSPVQAPPKQDDNARDKAIIDANCHLESCTSLDDLASTFMTAKDDWRETWREPLPQEIIDTKDAMKARLKEEQAA